MAESPIAVDEPPAASGRAYRTEPPERPESIWGDPRGLYTVWGCSIAMKNKLFGGVPSNPKVIEGWLRKQTGISDDAHIQALVRRTLQERGYAPEEMTEIEADELLEEMASTLNQNGFKGDRNGLYVEGRQIMSMLRESVEVLFKGLQWKRRNGAAIKKSGESMKKAATSLFRESVHVPDERVYLGKQEPDGVELKIVHPKDPGRESSLSYVEYVEYAVLSFAVEELTGTVPSLGAWKEIWQHAERNGLGAMRSQQHGKFVVTRWEAL